MPRPCWPLDTSSVSPRNPVFRHQGPAGLPHGTGRQTPGHLPLGSEPWPWGPRMGAKALMEPGGLAGPRLSRPRCLGTNPSSPNWSEPAWGQSPVGMPRWGHPGETPLLPDGDAQPRKCVLKSEGRRDRGLSQPPGGTGPTRRSRLGLLAQLSPQDPQGHVPLDTGSASGPQRKGEGRQGRGFRGRVPQEPFFTN